MSDRLSAHMDQLVDKRIKSKKKRKKGNKPHHGHGVQLTQGLHGLEQQHNDTATLNRFDRSREEIGRESFEILQGNGGKK